MTAEMRGVLVVDMGTQYTQLIARRVRESGTWCQIATPDEALKVAREMDLGGLILSGGPSSVYDEGAPNPDTELLSLGVPVLGICYGMQWMCQTLGGSVEATDTREYGRTQMTVETAEGMFHGVEGDSVVWMSHGDEVTSIPEGFTTHASSESCAYAAVADQARGLWGVQFHPEVTHTERGAEMLENFLARVCEFSGDWSEESIVDREVAKVRAQVRETRLEPTEAPRVAQYVPGTRRAREPDAPSGSPNSGACSSAAARTRSRTSCARPRWSTGWASKLSCSTGDRVVTSFHVVRCWTDPAPAPRRPVGDRGSDEAAEIRET